MTIVFTAGDAGELSNDDGPPVVRLSDALALTVLRSLHGVPAEDCRAGFMDAERFWARHARQSRVDHAMRIVHEGLEKLAAWATLHRLPVHWSFVEDLLDPWCDQCLREVATREYAAAVERGETPWTVRLCSACGDRVEADPAEIAAVEAIRGRALAVEVGA